MYNSLWYGQEPISTGIGYVTAQIIYLIIQIYYLDKILFMMESSW